MPEEPKLPRWNPTLSAGQGHMAHDRFGHDPGKIPMGSHPNRRRILVGLVVVLVVVVVAVVVLVRVLGGGPAQSVSDVADDLAAAAGDGDRAAVEDVFCADPTTQQDASLDRIDGVGDTARFEIADVEGEQEGSFRLTVVAEEGPPEQQYAVSEVQVAEDGDRSCVEDLSVELRDGPPPIDR